MPSAVDKYLHIERFPHIWCPGCGIGTVTGAFLRAALDLGPAEGQDGGVGEASAAPVGRSLPRLRYGARHHRRALAFATGIKMPTRSSPSSC